MKTIVLLLCLLPMGAVGQTQSSAPPKVKPNTGQGAPSDNPSEWAYGMKSFARAIGNVGGWWSFLNENEKSAFLDGYKFAMDRSYAHSYGACKILKSELKTSSDQEAFMNQMKMAMLACEIAEDFDGFDKVTTKDIDEFYSDPVNQPMLLEWSLPYLRDKVTGRKTAGQLLDALLAEQKDVHDCTKYPGLCKLGIK